MAIKSKVICGLKEVSQAECCSSLKSLSYVTAPSLYFETPFTYITKSLRGVFAEQQPFFVSRDQATKKHGNTIKDQGSSKKN